MSQNDEEKDTPPVDIKAKAKTRAGWDFDVPGELLDPDSKLWTEKQREKGVTVGAVYLRPKGELQALNRAAADGGGGGVMYAQVELSLAMIDGETIPYADRAAVWDGLGPQGRLVAIEMYTMAHQVSAEASARVRASFRVRA